MAAFFYNLSADLTVLTGQHKACRMKCPYISVCIVFLLLTFIPVEVWAQKAAPKTIIENFIRWFTGDFNSLATGGQLDTSSRSLTLHHLELGAWNMGDSTIWVYEEIDYTHSDSQIFRQLVWCLKEQANGTIIASQYLLKKGWLFTNAWKSEDLFRQLNSDYLVGSAFCELSFDLTNQHYFKGYTARDGCPNHFKKAVRYSNQSSVTQTQYDFWERGFDAAGNQVWGNPKEGYQFVRQVPVLPDKAQDPAVLAKSNSLKPARRSVASSRLITADSAIKRPASPKDEAANP